MCECVLRGLTTVVGIETFKCNLERDENCSKCVQMAEKIANDYFNKLMESVDVTNTSV